MKEAVKKRPGRGRPSKFTPEIQERILQAVRGGAFLEDAAELGGVSRETLLRWLKDGEASPRGVPLREFSDAVAMERASAKVGVMGKIFEASSHDWKAGAWWLGVTDPKNYAPRVREVLQEEFEKAILRISRLPLPPDVLTMVLTAIAEQENAEVAIGAAPTSNVYGAPL